MRYEVSGVSVVLKDFHDAEGGGGGGGRARSDWQFVLESIDRLNKLVTANESAFAPFSLRGEIEDLVTKTAATNDNESTSDNYLNQAVSGRGQHLHENSQPSYSQRVSKQLTSSQILRALALERSWSATTQLAKSIIVGYDQRTLENAADEVRRILSCIRHQNVCQLPLQIGEIFYTW